MLSFNLPNSVSPVANTTWPQSGPAPLLTTIDVARVLHIAVQNVRKLVRRGTLAAERTLHGRYLFRQDDVEELAAARVKAALTLVKPRMARARNRPRQLTLFGLYRRRGKLRTRFRPDVYGFRSELETAADRSEIRRRASR